MRPLQGRQSGLWEGWCQSLRTLPVPKWFSAGLGWGGCCVPHLVDVETRGSDSEAHTGTLCMARAWLPALLRLFWGTREEQGDLSERQQVLGGKTPMAAEATSETGGGPSRARGPLRGMQGPQGGGYTPHPSVLTLTLGSLAHSVAGWGIPAGMSLQRSVSLTS